MSVRYMETTDIDDAGQGAATEQQAVSLSAEEILGRLGDRLLTGQGGTLKRDRQRIQPPVGRLHGMRTEVVVFASSHEAPRAVMLRTAMDLRPPAGRMAWKMSR